ncbi:MAG: LysR family transcriptional regulator [Acidobacteriota bacterium]|nr:LysR family transcriptional regulator [Acidobacteriota bacterium]
MIARKLEYLLALAREGHFARAAAACHVSQPALSAGIQQLESEFGLMLVKRGQRYQGLTEEGETVLAWAQRTAIECQRLQQELRDGTGQLAGTLRLGVMGSATPITSWLTVPFAKRFPKIRLRIVIQSGAQIMQELEEFSLDVGITILDEKVAGSMRSARLYDEEFQLLIRKGSAFSGRPTVSWDEVQDLPLCLFTPESYFPGTQESKFLWTAPQTPQIAAGSILLLVDHVRTGHWASVVPRTIIPIIANQGDLEAIPLRPKGRKLSMGIVIPHRDPPSPVADTFFEIASSREVRENIARSLAGSRATAPKPDHTGDADFEHARAPGRSRHR